MKTKRIPPFDPFVERQLSLSEWREADECRLRFYEKLLTSECTAEEKRELVSRIRAIKKRWGMK